MRLAAVDIYNAKFGSSALGYNKSQVDDFLQDAARDFEALSRENVELRQQVEELGKRLADYARLEESIRKALVMAQSQADESRANARKEGELITQQARQEAAQILDQARSEARQLEEQTARMRQMRERFTLEFGTLLRGHLAALESETRVQGG